MKHLRFTYFATYFVVFCLLFVGNSLAQTNIVLPAACANCSAGSTNGTAIVSNYGNSSCANPSSGTINGTLTQGVATSGVTMILYANVTTVGSWNITTVANNGVTFSGSGTFTTLGCQPITLTASGTPTSAGAITVSTNTNPVGNASTTVAPATAPSTNGTAVVSAYGGVGCTGNGILNGTYTVGQATTSANTLTFYANVTTLGSWNITTIANNGVTFTGSGTFTTIGCQQITLTASGTPTSAGSLIANTNTNPIGSATTAVSPPSSPSTNGGAVVASYGGLGCTGNGILNGTYTVNQAVTSANTLTFYANVTQIGSWNITTTANNGVSFSGSGTFTSLGCQQITLNASGTPTSAGSLIANTNTNPIGSATTTVSPPTSPSTNGGGVVASYGGSGCLGNGVLNGTYIVGQALTSANTLTFYANVTQIGSWNITTTANNGVYFSGTGTFTSLGCQAITLNGSGTPTSTGSLIAVTNTSPAGTASGTVIAASTPSTNGTAVVSNYGNSSCANPSSGTIYGSMTQGVAVNGVTMILYANVTQVGSWTLSAVQNGVTFSGTGNFTTLGCQAITLNATGIPTSTGTNTWTTNSSPAGTSTGTTVAPNAALPANITLTSVKPHFIASVYDQDYTPYIVPTGTATLAMGVAAGGGNEATLVNVQGTLTTTGVTIKIPYTVSSGSVNLPAYSQTITIPANYTEDGIPRDVTFSYNATTLASGTGNITATLKAVGGTLNAKKLDIQTGVGNDNLGWLLGQFSFATNNAGSMGYFQLRDIAGIPDRRIDDANHVMLYLPITAENGSVWLNNDLGANYSNTAKAAFNPGQQATGSTDYNAYGSLFQWNRYSDGHELINWTDGNAGAPVGGVLAGPTSTNRPNNNSFYKQGTSAPYDWLSPQETTLWNGVSAFNNPCPFGYRVPDQSELTSMGTAANITGSSSAYNSILKLPSAGGRFVSDGLLSGTGAQAHYWSKNPNGTLANVLTFNLNNQYGLESHGRAYGFSIRCIQDNSSAPVIPAASVGAINCSGATTTGTLAANVAASGVSTSVPFTSGNYGTYSGQTVTSTGVTGLTATLASGSLNGGSGNVTYTITGTPSGSGTSNFALSLGGQTCTLGLSVVSTAPTNATGTSSFSGKTCFDVAKSNDNTNSCGPLSERLTRQANFTQAATNTQTYTFIPTGTVSNVRFVYVNTNGAAITALTGGNSGNNISSSVSATVTYANTLNTTATGLTNSNPITSDIYVVYNNSANNSGSDVQIKLTANIKDCACCGAYVAAGVWKEFLCHNLGADTSLDPNILVQGIHGDYYQWGRNTVVANASTAAGAISGWNTTPATNGAWNLGTLSAPIKNAANDPCPTGYRVPTIVEYAGVNDATLNTKTFTGTFIDSITNFDSGISFGPNASTKTLTLPVAGWRDYVNGALLGRGNNGKYWTSTEDSTGAYLYWLTDTNVTGGHTYNGLIRTNGHSVRCIQQ